MSVTMEQAILVGAVVLFVLFLLWNGLLRAPLKRSARARLETPGGADAELTGLLDQLRNGAQTGPVLAKIKKRVANTTDPKLQAVYLCAAGDVLRCTVSRRGTALRYYVKALGLDPTCIAARHGMRALLLSQRRGFKLEQIYWTILSRLDFVDHDCGAVVAVWQELADLLARRRSGRARARALQTLLDHVVASREECVPDDEPAEGSQPPDCLED
jgi:hypothetical protein